MIRGCYVTDSLQFSTPECFYSDMCLSVLYHYINITMASSNTGVDWYTAHTLVYRHGSTRYAINATFESIFEEMMIEQWNSSSSFEQYYGQCAPSHCTYSQTGSKKSFTAIMIKLISTISGLVPALHLITPRFVNILFYILQPQAKRQRQGWSTYSVL